MCAFDLKYVHITFLLYSEVITFSKIDNFYLSLYSEKMTNGNTNIKKL